jgi:Tol biopolymer transport system component
VRWVSVYSSPSWSPNGDRIAFEEYSRTQEGDLHKVKIVALGDRSITTIADGWFPSWSPNGNEVAFITTNGSRCYEVDLRSHERRLIWWSFRTLLADDIIGPALWAPADYGVFLNVTSGIKGDMRDGYYVDIASGKTRRISYDPDFEVVGLQMQKDRGRTEPRASRSDFR